jgi:hypothetical protein
MADNSPVLFEPTFKNGFKLRGLFKSDFNFDMWVSAYVTLILVDSKCIRASAGLRVRVE